MKKLKKKELNQSSDVCALTRSKAVLIRGAGFAAFYMAI